MKQSRLMSLVEAVANVVVGYGLAVAAQLMVFPWFGLPARVSDALAMGAIFTIISILRSYLLRRAFESFRPLRSLRARSGQACLERERNRMPAPDHGKQHRHEAFGLRIAVLATAGIAILIAVAGLAPTSGPVPGSDKLHHALGFAALTVPIAIVRPSWAPVVFLGACGYGAALELVQPMFGRAAEIDDFWADAAGAAAGSVIGACLAGIIRKWPRLGLRRAAAERKTAAR